MSYHHDFWVTVGAAAPVIALATVVSAAEVGREAYRFPAFAQSAEWDAGDAKDRRRLRSMTGAFVVVITVAFWSQVYALIAALLSLVHEEDRWPMMSLVVLEPLAIALLYVAGGLSFQIRAVRRRLERSKKTPRNEAAGPATSPP